MNQALGKKWYMRQCAVGTGICLGVYVLLLSLLSLLITRGVIGEGQTERCVWAIAAAASFAGTTLCGKKTVKRGMMALGCVCCFYALTLLMGFLIGGTLTPARVVWLILPIMGGGAVSFLLPAKKNARKRRTNRRGKVRR